MSGDDLLPGTQCVAIYKFEGKSSDDLGFNEGDVLTIIEDVGNLWCKARTEDGKEGFIPANYVQKVISEGNDPAAQNTHQSEDVWEPGTECVALWDFEATDSEDLAFNQGELLTVIENRGPGWYLGRTQDGREGLIPDVYVRKREVVTEVTKMTVEHFDARWVPGTECLAKYNFQGNSSGDLPFNKGEILTIVNSTRDPNWYRARTKDGREGMIPFNYVEEHVPLKDMPWFHGKITREQSEALLKPPEDGMFLVRESTNFTGDYTLCVSFGAMVEYYRVISKNNRFTIDEEIDFDNLKKLVEHYEKGADGLCTTLRKPALKKEEMDLDTFFLAVQFGYVQTVREGLEAGVDVNAKSDSWTFLHVASECGQTEVAELLIKNGADLEARDSWLDWTSLHVASRNGQTEVAELLIKNGANLEARDRVQSTPLHEAAAWGHTGTCELLIRSGADVTAKNEYQSTPLHEAAAEGHTGTCELLIRSGADVTTKDKYQSTPLHKAAAGGHTRTCELLIRSGADVTATDKKGKAPLDYARDPETRRHWKNLDKQVKQEKSYHELMQKSGGVKFNRFKVFVGGKEATGKSTLKQSLTKGLLSALIQRLSRRSVSQPHDPTPGVDIGTFHVPGVGEVSVWDFAGQAEYAVTHNMFMNAENTVFVVLYNIMDDKKAQEQQVTWWLCFIKSCNPNRQPDVILVASNADQVDAAVGQDRAALVVQTMQTEFRDHLRISDEVILMDCRKTVTPEMDRLKSLLVRIGEALIQHQRDMPKLCAKVMKRLPKWCKSKVSPNFPVMMWPDYVKEVKELDRFVTEDFLKKSSRFLHHLAEILFITPATSDPIIVLKPNWLGTDVFGRVMAPDYFENHLNRTSEDYVTREELQRVFQDVADVDLVITLLQEFQLCHTFDKETYIIPGLLTQKMPDEVWQPPAESKMVYFGMQIQCADSTDMLSSGFFPQVQTRLMRELENRPSLWRDGAKCVDRDVEGLIKLSPDGRAVNICVRSLQGDKLKCGEMLQQLENINADVLYEYSPGTGTVEKVLSSRALKEHRDQFYSYGKEEIKQAWEEGGTIVHRTLAIEEYICDLLCREDEDPLAINRPELVQVLRHVEPILDQLQAHGTLTAEECDVIRAKETPQDKARKLLDTIGRKGAPASRDFKAVLKQIIPHAAEMVQGHANDLCMEDEDPFRKNRPKLVQDLTSSSVMGDVLNHLLSRDILSDEEYERIRAKETPRDKARELLDIMRTKHKSARDVFKEVLREVNPHVAELLT